MLSIRHHQLREYAAKINWAPTQANKWDFFKVWSVSQKEDRKDQFMVYTLNLGPLQPPKDSWHKVQGFLTSKHKKEVGSFLIPLRQPYNVNKFNYLLVSVNTLMTFQCQQKIKLVAMHTNYIWTINFRQSTGLICGN